MIKYPKVFYKNADFYVSADSSKFAQKSSTIWVLTYNTISHTEAVTMIKALTRLRPSMGDCHVLDRPAQVTVFRLRIGHIRLNAHNATETQTVIFTQVLMWSGRPNYRACPSKTPICSTTEIRNMVQKCPCAEEAVWQCGRSKTENSHHCWGHASDVKQWRRRRTQFLCTRLLVAKDSALYHPLWLHCQNLDSD